MFYPYGFAVFLAYPVDRRNGEVDGEPTKEQDHKQDNRQPDFGCHAPAQMAELCIRPVLHAGKGLMNG